MQGMTIKDSFGNVCDPQYQLFHEHVKQYLKVVPKQRNCIQENSTQTSGIKKN